MSTEIPLKMSELNINDRLPPEMLAKIFLSLDEVNLKNATLACKLWNDLISSTHRWSLKLRYEHGKLMCRNFNSKQKINFVLTTPRKFGTIEIRIGRRSNYDHIFKIFEKHGSHVVNLRLSNCRIGNSTGLARLLSLTPNLTDVSVTDGQLCSPSDLPPDRDLPDLSKLENLKTDSTDLRMTHFFRKAKLTTITFEGYSEHVGAWVDFLSCQERLTSLTYYSGTSMLNILDDMTNWNDYRFQLTHLTVISYGGESEPIRAKNFIVALVNSQAKNLRELRLCGVPRYVHESVFCISMTKLDSLSVATNELPRYNDFYEQMQENCTVRVMKLYNSTMSHDLEYLGKFLNKFSNIRRLILTFGCVVDHNILLMVRNISKLESLALNAVDEYLNDAFGCLNFPHLKTLDIQDLRSKINWDAFTKIHSRLAELSIGSLEQESFLTSDDIDQITTNVDLRTLRLGHGFVADDRFFEIVRSKCANMKVLDLYVDSVWPAVNYP